MLACAGFVAYELFAFRRNLASEVSTLAEVTGKNCVGAMAFDNALNGGSMLASLSGANNVVAACIFKDGKPWAKYPKNLDERVLPSEAAGPMHRFEKNTLQVFRPILEPDTHEKLGTIYVQANLEQARLDFQRVEALYQTGSATRPQYDADKARLDATAARRQATQKQIRAAAPHTLFLLAGDFISPSVASRLFKGKQMIDALNACLDESANQIFRHGLGHDQSPGQSEWRCGEWSADTTRQPPLAHSLNRLH